MHKQPIYAQKSLRLSYKLFEWDEFVAIFENPEFQIKKSLNQLSSKVKKKWRDLTTVTMWRSYFWE